MSALGPLCLTNESHYRVVVNSLPRERGIVDQLTDSVELDGYLKGPIFNFCLHRSHLFFAFSVAAEGRDGFSVSCLLPITN